MSGLPKWNLRRRTSTGSVCDTSCRLMAILVDSEHSDWELEFQNSTDGSGTNVFELGGEAEDSSNRYFDFRNLGGIYFSTACFAKLTGTGATVHLWIDGTPTTSANILVSDTFTGADTTTLPNHDPDVDVVGGGWTDADAGITIESNKASDNDVTALSVIDSGEADVVITATMVIQGGGSGFNGLVFRYQDSTHYFIAGCDLLNDVTAVWINNAGFSQIANPAHNYTAGETVNLRVTLSGSSIKVDIDGVNEVDITNTNFATATSHGLYNDAAGGGTDATWDNFLVVPNW